MKTLVVLSAVLAAAVARPGSLAAVQSPTADAVSSKAPAVRANSDQGANVGATTPVRIARGLQNSVPGASKTPRPANPTRSNSFPVSDGSDESFGTRFVDNPHIGLPFGTVLPLRKPISLPQFSPTASTGGTSTTFRIDSPHVGLPPQSASPDSPASTTIVSSPVSAFQPGTASDSAFGNSLHSSEVPSKGDSASNLSINSSPVSLTVNNDDVRINNQPKSHFSVNPAFPDVFIPINLPTHSTHVLFPVSTPISHVPSSASPPVTIGSTSLPMNNGNIDFLISDPFGGFFTKTVNSQFLSKIPSSVFTPTSSQGKFFHSLPINSATSSPPSHIPVNTASFTFPSSSPNTYPLTPIAFTVNNPPHSVPTISPSSNLFVNSANVLLFSDTVPFGNVVNTPQGPALIGGPSNFAIFPRQPSLDDISQVLAAHKVPVAPAPTAAVSPASSNAVRPSPGTFFFAGVPVSLGGSQK